MIVQGFNCPLVLLLTSDISSMANFHAQLTTKAGTTLKEWGNDDCVIKKNVVTLPIKQAESAAFPSGVAMVTAIWANDGEAKGGTRPAPVMVSAYPDKTILGNDAAVTDITTTLDVEELPDASEITEDMLRAALVVKVGGASDAEEITFDSGTEEHAAGSVAEAIANLQESELALNNNIATLDTALSTETEARETADSALDSRVTALENGGSSGSGVTAVMASTLWAMLQKAAYTEADMSSYVSAFKTAWGISNDGIAVSFADGVLSLSGFASTPTISAS